MGGDFWGKEYMGGEEMEAGCADFGEPGQKSERVWAGGEACFLYSSSFFYFYFFFFFLPMFFFFFLMEDT